MIKGRSNGPNRRPSMGQDVYRGRKTEIRFMNGHVLDHAKKMNIPLPYTALTVETILKIDAKEIIPDKENIYSIIQSIK